MAGQHDRGARVVALRSGDLGCLHPATAGAVFWELDPAATGDGLDASELDKEAWLVARAYAQDPVGFSIAAAAGETDLHGKALATVLFCPPADAPGAARMPTAPVSDDAWLVTSLHIEPEVRRRGWESVLLDVVIGAATAAGVAALEVFGIREAPADSAEDEFTGAGSLAGGGSLAGADISRSDLTSEADRIGLVSVAILESAGFRVQADHPVLPRLRLSLPPQFDLLTAHEIADLLATTRA